MVGVGEKLEGAAAKVALEVVFHGVARPVGLEEVFQRTSAFGQDKGTFFYQSKQAMCEFEVSARLIDRESGEELVAPWAGRHWISVPPLREGQAVSKVLG